LSRAAALLLAAALLGIGCKQGASSLQLTVTSSTPLHGVDHLRVIVVQRGVTAHPLDFPLVDRPVDLPPAQTLTLVFGAERRGAVAVTVDARDAANRSLGIATQNASITPGQASTATVTLAAVTGARYTVSGFVGGLGGGISRGAGFVVEGTIGLPGPRVISSGGGLSVEPLIPRSAR
jgi:hypothetical protein